ncbi:DUF2490 domain-containing protein [Flavobacterium fluviatile]|uniref:DUF2490 domain-containing protein n=1 Tax=Flavobacterium fluviatile TaxID=1862387 RepID=UPI0013D3E2FB|nr:DUF2490 domain-containing protein [Flavobacterium fluviatile]
MHSYLPLKQSIILFIISPITFLFSFCYGQNTHYGQLWNEIQFTRTLNEKWSTEFDIASSYSSEESSPNILDNNTQGSLRLWGHYYLNPRWKTSAFLAYYNNKDVPEIGQFKSPEWRFALQGIYYIHKIGYTLSTRSRLELRHLRNSDLEYENVLRYRQQIKYLKPVNSKVLRKGTIYAFTSDEIFLKTGTKVTGESFFDRNRFNLGAGYLFSDDFQFELSYVNEFLPRNNGNQTVNAASLTLTINNLFKNFNTLLHKHESNSTVKEDE